MQRLQKLLAYGFLRKLKPNQLGPCQERPRRNNVLDFFNVNIKVKCYRYAPLIEKKVRGVKYLWLAQVNFKLSC